MTQFEYTDYMCIDVDFKLETLNELGREGWELVTHSTVATDSDEYGLSVWHYFFFRRPLVTTEDVSRDDVWNYDEWQEHQKNIIKQARELREVLEQ